MGQGASRHADANCSTTLPLALLILLLGSAPPASAATIWQDTAGDPRIGDGQANDVVATATAVFVSGFIGGTELLVRACAPASGRLLWQHRDDSAWLEGGRLALLGDRLFGVMFASRGDAGGYDWAVRVSRRRLRHPARSAAQGGAARRAPAAPSLTSPHPSARISFCRRAP